jgi:DNA (cytosine-5)-methyltransferase 1
VDKDIKVVELFAGVGGFRQGLKISSERFVTVWANQWEPGKKKQYAFDCYNFHFKNSSSSNVNEDIAIAKNDVPDHDLLVGGFPCQDYSVAATNAKGIEGKKGVLWWHINDIIKAKRPKYILLENVDRLLKSPSSQRGRDFGIILRCMADNEYSVEWRVINAADYGEAQKRRRVFIFASRNDTKHYQNIKITEKEDVLVKKGFFAKEFPIKLQPIQKKMNSFSIDKKKYKTLIEISNDFAEQLFSGGIMIDYKVYTRDCIAEYNGSKRTLYDIRLDQVDTKYFIKEPEPWIYLKGSKKIDRVKKSNGAKYIYSEGAIPYPDPIDRPGRTMLTSEGTKNRSTHIIIDKKTGKIRLLTPIECERLNGFPDNWTDTIPERARYFTMGNALVVQLITKMGNSILNIEDEI